MGVGALTARLKSGWVGGKDHGISTGGKGANLLETRDSKKIGKAEDENEILQLTAASKPPAPFLGGCPGNPTPEDPPSR